MCAGEEPQRTIGHISWLKWATAVGGDPFRIGTAWDLAEKLMAEHGVSDWTLRIGHAKRRDGGVVYPVDRRTRAWTGEPGSITLSGPLLSLWPDEQQRNVILHEIAHALAPGDHHGALWAFQCARLGIPARPRWGEEEESLAPDLPWVGTCPCGRSHQRSRAPKPGARYVCTPCRGTVTWQRRS